MATYELFQDDQMVTHGRLLSPSEKVGEKPGRYTVELSPEEAIRYEEFRHESIYWDNRLTKAHQDAYCEDPENKVWLEGKHYASDEGK